MLEVTRFNVNDLQFFYKNPRRGNVEKIAESLENNGQYRAIVVNIGTFTGRANEVLAGNHTLQAARKLGWSHIDATTVDVDDNQAAKIVAADNRLADLGGYDNELLAEVLGSIDDLSGTGYSDLDLAELLRDIAEPVALTDPDDAPPLPETEPVSRLGDLWILGNNWLYVGSSGDTAEIKRVLPEQVACVWTDPPYGVEYQGKTEQKLTIANDSEEEALEVWRAALATIVEVARPGCPVYAAVPNGELTYPFIQEMKLAGLSYRQELVWVKNHFSMGRSDYHPQHETIITGQTPEDTEGDSVRTHTRIAYGFTGGGQGRLGRGGEHWFGGNKASTVFDIPKPHASRLHPTMKPIALIASMLRNSCPPGGIVFDSFGGSGSTLIAAHQVGARAFLCELLPKYADVICRRFQEHTGIVPKRDGKEVNFITET